MSDSDPIRGRYHDGQQLAAQAVTLVLPGDGTLRIIGLAAEQTVRLDDIAMAAPVADVPRFLRLPNGGSIEVAAHPEIDDALNPRQPSPRYTATLHALETHSLIAAAATMLLVVAAAASFWWGLPALSRRLAYALPANLEKKAGEAAGVFFDRQVGPSQLSTRERRLAVEPLEKLLHVRSPHVRPRLIFKNMNVTNAFALPGGDLVVSDSLVWLALKESNGADLLAAVYAHEIAHVERRHGLQLVLRSSTALLAVATLTGDLSTLTSFSGTLPFLLIQKGYAREFESEADADAADLLRAAHISPSSLGDMLALLEKAQPKTGPDFTYLSTHPSTADRIQRLRALK